MATHGLSRWFSCCSAVFALALGLCPASVRADAESPDPTRLDVERLPPEAISVTRGMFKTGFHVVAELGGQGLVHGAGRLSRPGPLARVGVGYELTRYFSLGSLVGLGFHATDAPPPPNPTAFQLYTVLAQAKLQLALGARAALWLAAEGGVGWASSDFLQVWGFKEAGRLGFVYGATSGFDWHLLNAHHSLGLRVGGHFLPNLKARDGEQTISLDSAVYLKYVF